MPDSKPRDLTVDELELAKAPAIREQGSMPLPVPPGMLTPVSLFDPGSASLAVVTSPSAEPPVAAAGR